MQIVSHKLRYGVMPLFDVEGAVCFENNSIQFRSFRFRKHSFDKCNFSINFYPPFSPITNIKFSLLFVLILLLLKFLLGFVLCAVIAFI